MASPLQTTSPVAELPYREDGTVDWDILGKILTANILAEVVYASYVDTKHGCARPDFKADTDWVYDYEKDDIVVMKKHSERTFFLGRGVIDVPLQVVAECIKDVQSSFIWDTLLVKAEYLKVLSQTETCTDYIGYQRWETTQCFVRHKRDMLYFIRCTYMPDGKYVQTALSIEDHDYPPHPEVLRIDARSGCGFVLEPYKGDSSRTLFNYLGNIDMKKLPMFIMIRVLKTHPINSIKALRKHFSKQSRQVPVSRDLNPERHSLSVSRSRRFEDVLPVEYYMNPRRDTT